MKSDEIAMMGHFLSIDHQTSYPIYKGDTNLITSITDGQTVKIQYEV